MKNLYKITSEYNIVTNQWTLTYFNLITFLIYALFFLGYEKIKVKAKKGLDVIVNSKRFKIIQHSLWMPNCVSIDIGSNSSINIRSIS